MNGFHVERMTEDEGDTQIPAQIGDPIPAEHAFDRNGEIFISIWLENRGEDLRRSFVILVHQHGARSIGDAEVHRSCMQIDPAIELVVMCVESPLGFLLGWVILYAVIVPHFPRRGAL
jgi:hypothetical protein